MSTSCAASCAQLERAILWGFDVSHLASHLGTLQLRPEFFDVYLELAIDFGLPLRLSGGGDPAVDRFPFRKLAAEEGVTFPDHLVAVRETGSRRAIERAVYDLRPGVTELYVRPAVDTPELRAMTPDWAARVDDHDLVVNDHSLATMLERAEATLVGFRALRDLQRELPTSRGAVGNGGRQRRRRRRPGTATVRSGGSGRRPRRRGALHAGREAVQEVVDVAGGLLGLCVRPGRNGRLAGGRAAACGGGGGGGGRRAQVGSGRGRGRAHPLLAGRRRPADRGAAASSAAARRSPGGSALRRWCRRNAGRPSSPGRGWRGGPSAGRRARPRSAATAPRRAGRPRCPAASRRLGPGGSASRRALRANRL